MPNFIIAGGAGRNEIKIFENNPDTNFRQVCHVNDFDTPCLSIDHSKSMDNWAFGTQDGRIYLMTTKVEESTSFPYTQGMLNDLNERVAGVKKEEEDAKAMIEAKIQAEATELDRLRLEEEAAKKEESKEEEEKEQAVPTE